MTEDDGALTQSLPAFSVITISFHDLDGLKRTVNSVRAQRYSGRIEHIVIDGGSGQHVVDYLSRYNSGFKHWQSRPDGGRYDAMNQGIKHASGDLLWFMNSGDCFSDPDAIAQVAKAVSGCPAREIWGYGGANLIAHDGSHIGRKVPVPFDLCRFLTRGITIPHQATFFGSLLVGELGEYDCDFGIIADQLYIFGAALLREPIAMPRVLCDFDVTGVGTGRPLRDHFRDMRRICAIHRFYPVRGRWMSLTYMRCVEYWFRAKEAASLAWAFLLAQLDRRISA